jgi:hypothetical protein
MKSKKPVQKKKEKKSPTDITDFSVRNINPEIKYFTGKDSNYMVFRFCSTNKKNKNSFTYTVYKAVTANHAAYDIDESLVNLKGNTRQLWDSLWFRTDVNYQVEKFIENKKKKK